MKQDEFTKLSPICHQQARVVRGISNQKAGDFKITRFLIYKTMAICSTNKIFASTNLF
jgi:hypothetical protein